MERTTNQVPALLVGLLVLILPLCGAAEQGLGNCAEVFPGKTIKNAPLMTGAPDASPASGNLHICERWGKVPFFALEYSPQHYAPLWVGYRIEDTFGQNGCKSMTRDEMRCYFKQDNIASCLKKKKSPDPFHPEILLSKLKMDRLSTSAFSGTSHDRGHMAPNNSFSWHACGAYKTFTMANMAAQWGSHNQQLWANLELQVLYWGVKLGPIYVVTGPTWGPFPANEFASIRSGEVRTTQFAKPNELLKKTGGRALKKDIPRPTGFYKVVFLPARDNQPDRAIAFLTPHTKERNLSHWNFVAPVSLVEKTAGLRFGFSQSVKDVTDLKYWRGLGKEVPARWSPRQGCKNKIPVAGWLPQLSVDERIAVCTASEEPQ